VLLAPVPHLLPADIDPDACQRNTHVLDTLHIDVGLGVEVDMPQLQGASHSCW
jgi:hypothetical protein